jgi:cell division protein FtsB
MLDLVYGFAQKQIKILRDPRNVALYIFAIIVLAISWSTVKTIQSNYDLQRQIAALKQQNDILALQNNNQRLQNTYYQTDSYQELAARQNLGLAAPGEKILLVPKAVALKYAGTAETQTNGSNSTDNRPTYIKHIEAWRDFLLGRQVSDYGD